MMGLLTGLLRLLGIAEMQDGCSLFKRQLFMQPPETDWDILSPKLGRQPPNISRVHAGRPLPFSGKEPGDPRPSDVPPEKYLPSAALFLSQTQNICNSSIFLTMLAVLADIEPRGLSGGLQNRHGSNVCFGG
jgi:hypothetical protein